MKTKNVELDIDLIIKNTITKLKVLLFIVKKKRQKKYVVKLNSLIKRLEEEFKISSSSKK